MRPPTRAAKHGWRDRLVDSYIDSYVEWREGCADLHGAYQRWALSEPSDRGLAFLAYRAALDREEKAALVYELVADQLGHRAGRWSRGGPVSLATLTKWALRERAPR